jgi:hypothetical protein
MQHYCPLHPQVVEAIVPLLVERRDDEPMFKQLSFARWLKQQKVPLLHGSHHFVPGDLRKFCEQMGDILQWDQSNKNYILTHGVGEFSTLTSAAYWRTLKIAVLPQAYGVAAFTFFFFKLVLYFFAPGFPPPLTVADIDFKELARINEILVQDNLIALGFAAAFLKYLAQERVDPRYLTFHSFLSARRLRELRKQLPSRLSLVKTFPLYSADRCSCRKRENQRSEKAELPCFYTPRILYRITTQHNPTLDRRAIQGCAE